MKVALIGYGYWGKILRRYIDASPDFELAAIAVKRGGISAPLFTTLERILLDTGIEAVFVCTPIGSHFEICEKCLLHGKHVFCEKPTVKTLARLQTLMEIAERQKRILYTDYIYTVSPSIRKIHEELGKIGDICSVTGEISQFGNFYPGDTVDEVLGVHLFSVLVYLFPGFTVSSISDNGCNKLKEWERRICMTLNETIQVIFLYSLLSPRKTRWVKVTGTAGVFLFDMLDSEASLRYLRYMPVTGNQWQKTEEMKWSFDETHNLKHAVNDFKKAISEENNAKNIDISEKVMGILDRLGNNCLKY